MVSRRDTWSAVGAIIGVGLLLAGCEVMDKAYKDLSSCLLNVLATGDCDSEKRDVEPNM